jgi:agmatinase
MPPTFDPNAAATADSGIFGLPHTYAESAVAYLPVPWEATTSYGGGTADGPAAILEASRQVDLFDGEVDRPYEVGLHLLPESKEIRRRGRLARKQAAAIIARGGDIAGSRPLQRALTAVNQEGAWLNVHVEKETSRLLAAGKIVGLIGGDHSTPFGALQAVARRHRSFGVLQIDAHADLRRAYEGFTWSHASIMHNVLERIPAVSRLVQVGIRDFCEEEHDYGRAQGKRHRVFRDQDLQHRRHAGQPWNRTVTEIVATLPREVWISFDIDGLDQRFCPHTGTPVPGGLDFAEANTLIAAVARSGRQIIGFDLNEVAPDPTGRSEWDANVGARLLYKLTAWTLVSRGLRTEQRL